MAEVMVGDPRVDTRIDPAVEVAGFREIVRIQKPGEFKKEIQDAHLNNDRFWAKAVKAKKIVDVAVENSGVPLGIRNDPDAQDVKLAVWKIILGAQQSKDKIATKRGLDPDKRRLAVEAIKRISDSVDPETINEEDAPYFYDLFAKLMAGEVGDVDQLAMVFFQNRHLEDTSPLLNELVKTSLIRLAQDEDPSTDRKKAKEDAMNKFTVKERKSPREEAMWTSEDQMKMKEVFDRIYKKVESEAARIGMPEDEVRRVKLALQGGATLNEVKDLFRTLGVDEKDVADYAELLLKQIGNIQDIRLPQATLEDKFKQATLDLNPDRFITTFLTTNSAGELELTKESKEKFKKDFTEYFYTLFQQIDENPSQTWDEQFNQFHFTPYILGLQSLVSELLVSQSVRKTMDDNPNLAKVIPDFLNTMLMHSNALLKYAQLFHDLPIYANNSESFEKWPSFMASLYSSQLASLIDSPVMRIALPEVIERHNRRRIALNGNMIPNNLFGGRYDSETVLYQFGDREEEKRVIKERLEALRIPYQEWEIGRAISYGRGIGLMSLREIEVEGTANPPENFKSIPDLISRLIQKFKWKQGRGGGGVLHTPELLTMTVEQNPEVRGLWGQLRNRKRWVPEKIHHKAKMKKKELGDQIDRILLDRDGAYQELMNIFNIYSLQTRAGWRTSHLVPGTSNDMGRRLEARMNSLGIDYEKRMTDWERADWQDYFDATVSEMGVGSLWFFLDDRVSSEMNRALTEALGRPGEIWDHHQTEPYSLGQHDENHAWDKILKIPDASGRVLNLTYSEFKQIKEAQVKAEIFQSLFKRSPGDFLMNLTQLVPELTQLGKVDELVWEDKATLEVMAGKRSTLHAVDKGKAEKALKIRDHLVELWGEDGFKQLSELKDQFDVIVDELSHDTGVMDKLGKDPKFAGMNKSEQRERILSYFFNEMATALEKVRQDPAGKVEMEAADVGDPTVRRLVFGPGGVMQYMATLGEDFGDYNRIGNKGLFYKTAQNWTRKNGKVNPNTTDLDYVELYRDIAEAGENVKTRLHGDVHSWNEAIKGVADLDHILLDAAESRDLSKIYELHHKIHSIEGVVGIDEAQHANYIVASLVANYFWDHSTARMPGGLLLTAPIKFFYGKSLSLSKIHGNALSYSMGNTEIREYFRNLAFKHEAIAKTGRWSYEQAKMSYDATNEAYILGTVLPSVLSILAAYFIYKSVTKALEEEGLAKGGGGGGGGGGGHH